MIKLLASILVILSVTSYSQNDCPASGVCTGFSNTPNGAGAAEINGTNNGCLSVEHNSTWITITILTSGSLQFTINPNVNSNDFDFAVWGPNSPCPPTTAPIKCSWAVASGNGNTGINTGLNGGGPNSEGAGGDGWVNNLAVTAGQTYIILIDNFTTNSGFAMTFAGTSTLDCTLLPIELTSFTGTSYFENNTLNWTCASELNNDRFDIEHGTNGTDWTVIGTVKGAGNSSVMTSYEFKDLRFSIGINYYRLKQIDYDGQYEYVGILSISNITKVNKEILRITDILGREVELSHPGLKIIFYNDGSLVKTF